LLLFWCVKQRFPLGGDKLILKSLIIKTHQVRGGGYIVPPPLFYPLLCTFTKMWEGRFHVALGPNSKPKREAQLAVFHTYLLKYLYSIGFTLVVYHKGEEKTWNVALSTHYSTYYILRLHRNYKYGPPQRVILPSLPNALRSIDIKPPNHGGGAAAVNRRRIKPPICKY
jgi:hypothetical protein